MSKKKIIGLISAAAIFTTFSFTTVATINTKSIKSTNQILLTAPANTGNKAVVVNTSKAPLVLYKSANSNSNISSYVSVGEMLTIQNHQNGFYKVTVQETGATGYISGYDLELITSGVNSPYTSINKSGTIINIDSVVHLRANATMNSAILNNITNNTNVNVLGKQGEWYKVSVNGQEGFLYQEYVVLNASVTTTKTTTQKASNTQSTISTGKTEKKISNSNSTSFRPAIKNTNSAVKEAKIKMLIPIKANEGYGDNAVMVQNESKTPIATKQLVSAMKYWMSHNFMIYGSTYQTLNSTKLAWQTPWLDKISDSEYMNAFIKANGEKALSENITAIEFAKAAVQIYNTISQAPAPFNEKQVKKNIEASVAGPVIKIEKKGDAFIISLKNGDILSVNAYDGFMHSINGY